MHLELAHHRVHWHLHSWCLLRSLAWSCRLWLTSRCSLGLHHGLILKQLLVLVDGLLLHVDDLLLVQLLLFLSHVLLLAWRLTWLPLHHERVRCSLREALHTHSHHLRVESGELRRLLLSFSFRVLSWFSDCLFFLFAFFFFFGLVSILLLKNVFDHCISLCLSLIVISRRTRLFLICIRNLILI